MSTKTFYLLECEACTKGDDPFPGSGGFALIMPFGSAKERAEWATEHAKVHEGGTTWRLAEETRTQDFWPSDHLGRASASL